MTPRRTVRRDAEARPAATYPAGVTAHPPARPAGDRRAWAWAVFLAAALIYVLAVAARSSFAVAVPEAADRFPGGAGLLALFVVLQLAVYAAAQIPVGLLLDRLGARRVLVAGALVVALGQALLAGADTVPQAVVARVLVTPRPSSGSCAWCRRGSHWGACRC